MAKPPSHRVLYLRRALQRIGRIATTPDDSSINDADLVRAAVRADEDLRDALASAERLRAEPLAMLLVCPCCGERHIDEGVFATKVHHTHACQHCGTVWRPAIVATVGVRFLPGFKNEES